MKNNDISNRKAPSILFRVDNFLVKTKDTTKLDKIANMLMGTHKRAYIDPVVASVIKEAFRNTDYTIGVAILEKAWSKYTRDLMNELINLPIADVHIIHDNLDIHRMLNSGEYLIYVDDNESNVSQVGDTKCISLESFNNVIKGGFRFE